MTTGTTLGRAGSLLATCSRFIGVHRSPLPAARPHNDCGAHGVRLSEKYRRCELYETLTHPTPLKMGARVTRTSDEKLFGKRTCAAGQSKTCNCTVRPASPGPGNPKIIRLD
jgi:hypothetical protein